MRYNDGGVEMNLTRLIVFGFLGLIMLIGVVAAAWTIIPDPATTTVSDLGKAWGYTTHCPWAPYSTIIGVGTMLFSAAILLVIRRFWR